MHTIKIFRDIKKLAINIISLILGMHMMNISVNVDDRLLNIGNKSTNEIESIYELLKVSFLGEDHAIADNNELNEEKTSTISYFDNSEKPIIPTKNNKNPEQRIFISDIDDVKGLVGEITPPPPKC